MMEKRHFVFEILLGLLIALLVALVVVFSSDATRFIYINF